MNALEGYRVGAGGLTLLVILLVASTARCIEQISFKRDGREQHVIGEVLVEDEEGGVLLHAPDGTLWIIREEIVRRESDSAPFRYYDEEMAKQLLWSCPRGSRSTRRRTYSYCYNTSEAYVRWCGGLDERLNLHSTAIGRTEVGS